MTEGPWTVAANLRAPAVETLAQHKELAAALQRIGAAVRMSQNECVRADVRCASLEEVVVAWRNVNDILEDATMAAERSLATLLEAGLRTPPSIFSVEAQD